MRLAEFLSQRGHGVAIVCRKGDLLQSECARQGLPCYPVQFGMDFSPVTIRLFWELFTIHQTDILITNISKEFRTAGIAAVLKGIPHINRIGAVGDLRMTVKTRILYSVFVDAVFVPSQSLFDFFAQYRFLRPKLRMFHNAMSVPEFCEKQNPVTRFAVVAKLSQRKQVDKVIQVFHRIPDLPWELHIGGVGPELESLWALTRHLSLEQQVFFTGKKINPYEFLQDKDVGILYSTSEGLSNALLEYMAMSCAVIASNVDGTPEVITPDVDGLLVDPQNLVDLEQAIRLLITQPQRRRSLARQGYSTIRQHFNRDVIFPRIEAELHQLIQSIHR